MKNITPSMLYLYLEEYHTPFSDDKAPSGVSKIMFMSDTLKLAGRLL